MSKREIRRKRRMFTRQFYHRNRMPLALGVVQTILLVGVNLLFSWLLQMLVDVTTGSDNAMELGQLVWIGLAGVGLAGLDVLLLYHSIPRFISKAIGQYKTYVFGRISEKGIAAFSGENTAYYISALTNDANSIETDYLAGIFNLLDDSLSFVGAFALMLWYSPMLTGIAVAFALLPMGAAVFAGNRVAKAEKRVSEENEGYTSTLKDALTGFAVVKSFRAEKAICGLFRRRVKGVSDAKERRRKASYVVQGFAMVSSMVAQLGVFVVGAWMALSGWGITAGTLIAFVNLMGYVSNPIGSMPQLLASMRASHGLIDKLAQALDANVPQEGKAEKRTLSHGIELKGLSYSYDGQKQTLHDLNYRFEAGKCYAVVGGSGCGKSTLLNLLMASDPGYQGSIRFDDEELRELSTASVYDLASMIQQNVFLFNATIRENITMFAPFPEEEIRRAIRLSGLGELIRQRGEGYLCGENGSGLSGGEKQRIAIARSLLKKSDLLLADEATAALDAKTAQKISGAILGLEGLTRIVVTHSLDGSQLSRYDGILAMKDGTIVESGSFEQLMERKGYFYSLYTVMQ